MSTERGRGLLLAATLGYTVFVVYGSLVPMDFHARPFSEAMAAFRDIRYLQLGIASRADWVANILLFIPLAFLWMAAVWLQGRTGRLPQSALVGIGCIGLSVAIEFTQVYFPPRTVSLNDVLAESIGTAAGVVLWWTTGQRVMAWLERWSWVRGTSAVSELVLCGYLFVLLGYSVLPLDLTLSPVEIFHKWTEGRVLIVPFHAHYKNSAQMVYDLASDIAIWIPAAFLWLLSGRLSGRMVFGYVVLCAAAIEFLQLFVYSRITDSTDVLTAAVGGGLGILIARRVVRNDGREHGTSASEFAGKRAVLWLLATTAWLCTLAVVFWYPFDFRNDWGFVHQRLVNLMRVPFEIYYQGSEFRAITEVIHKTGFFLPLGGLLAIGAAYLRARLALPASLLHFACAALIASVAAVIEAGQLFLPTKHANLTDWALETLGGLGGYLLVIFLLPRLRRQTPRIGD